MDDLGILGWRGLGMVLTFRSGETSSRASPDELLSLLGYRLHSGVALLGEFLSLRYCKRRFGSGGSVLEAPHKWCGS